MYTFALISEGVTDNVFLEYIIKKNTTHDVDVNYIQPELDNTDAHHANHAGWTLVLDACSRMVEPALSANDFLVIQIDTDCGDNAAFNVPLTHHGIDRDDDELINDTINLIISNMGEDIYAKYYNRIVFCICIHSIESWILFINYSELNKKNCSARLNSKINVSNEPKYEKSYRRYKMFGKQIDKKTLRNIDREDGSFGFFLNQLDNIV